ncbi:MAG: C25 family cysteine peptidase, partial [Bacteroidetes bacterium]|nr:C25 family cysteine peptidase [Bacteroidota bacterium]
MTNKDELIQNEGEPGSPRLKSYTFLISIPPGEKVQVSLYNVEHKITTNYSPLINTKLNLRDSLFSYESVQLSEKYFKTDFCPSEEFEVLDYFWIKDSYCCAVKLNEFRYNWKRRELQEITDGELKIEFIQDKQKKIAPSKQSKIEDPTLKKLVSNYNDGLKFSSVPQRKISDTLDKWINYSKEYVKLAIIQDGIYRIGYDDLVKYGLNPDEIDPSRIKIFLKGKQIPIFVQGENDIKFNIGDFVEFWAEKNYNKDDYRKQVSKGQDYINYFDRYTDTTFVWLTFGGEKGARIISQIANQNSSGDTIKTYQNKLHFEKDVKLAYYDGDQPRTQLPFWLENKVWGWFESWELGGQKAFDLFANSVVPNSKIKTYVRAISLAAPSEHPNKVHNVGISFNNSNDIDSAFFNKNQTITLAGEFNSNLISNGQNRICIHNIPTGISPNNFLLDWFDIEYPRYLSAKYDNARYRDDSLYFSINEPIQRENRSIQISQITSGDLLLYKVKPVLKKFINIQLLGGPSKSLTFSDTISFDDAFYLVKNEFVKSPIFLRTKKFINIRNNTIGSDYIIISNEVLKSSVESYRKFIKENYNLRTSAYYVDDIYDEFNFGYKDPPAIKSFLYYAYLNWPEPKAHYLFLIGEANYDYKNNWPITPVVKYPDLVTSFGYPVSDTWYVCFDSLGINIPQLYVGRLPAINNDQVIYYLQKHMNYLARTYDFFNKRVLLFSGGFPENPGEIEQLKNANDNVSNILLNSVVKPRVYHFFKTADPFSNFGPYTYETVRNAIDSGAVYISYLGHSGTRTWDNGINSTQQLDNLYHGNPLMADFGCSTAKFAEPDIESFSELFVNDIGGQAIAYIGNSSVGFLSVATSVPQLFASYLADTPAYSLGELHFLSKMKLFQESGINDVNRSFNYCNILIGDPIIKLKLPPKPNLFVTQSSITTIESNINDKMDFFTLEFILSNNGRVTSDTIAINIIDHYKNGIMFNKKIFVKCPDYSEKLDVRIPILGLPGTHNLTIIIDSLNVLDEISKTDNIVAYSQNVSSASLRVLASESLYNVNKGNLAVLNPVLKNTTNKIVFSVDTLFSFSSPNEITVDIDSVYTSYHLSNLMNNKRYWWKAQLSQLGNNWTSVFSFYNTDQDFSWYLSNPLGSVYSQNVEYNMFDKKWELSKKQNNLRIVSEGFYDGATALIEYNGEDRVGTLLWGLATAILDPITLEPKKVILFKSGGANLVDSLASYINNLPNGTLIAMAIGTEARNYILGSDPNSSSRQAIKTLGSKFIEQVGYRESWSLFGKKGAKTGTVPEVYKKVLEGQSVIDTTFFSKANTGSIEFPLIKNVKSWDFIEIGQSGKISSYLIGEGVNGKRDTISLANLSSRVSLSELNSKKILSLQVVSKFERDTSALEPSISYIGVKYRAVAELGTNYQVVSMPKDTLVQGEEAKLSFYVYNVGESRADSFKVRVEVIKPDNSREKIFEQMVDSLGSEKRKLFNVSYNTASSTGVRNFQITIDPDNKILELYKDNNLYSVPFFVKANNAPASVKLTFDGNDIINGDYVSATPNIKVELNDLSLIPISDTSHVQLYLNNKRISLASKEINFSFSDNNPKFVVCYKPTLSDGTYTLKVIGTNATGTLIDSAGIVRKFMVSNQAQLLYVYNYPNPFSSETYFTFKLTQIPDELKIKIFTVSGRLIKELIVPPSNLSYDFNRIEWDGRDQD